MKMMVLPDHGGAAVGWQENEVLLEVAMQHGSHCAEEEEADVAALARKAAARKFVDTCCGGSGGGRASWCDGGAIWVEDGCGGKVVVGERKDDGVVGGTAETFQVWKPKKFLGYEEALNFLDCNDNKR